MATKTWTLRQIATGGTPANVLWWDPSNATPPTQATSSSGWTVAKTAANNYRDLVQGSETAAFSTTIVPNTTAPTVSANFASTAVYTPPTLLEHTSSITTLYEYNGLFPAGNWVFNFNVISVTAAATGAGRINLRVFKGKRNGTAFSGVTELTSAMQAGTIASAPTTTTARTSTVTWAAPQFYLNNEFLIVKVGWQITTASGSNSADILLRHGSGCNMTTPTFRDRSYAIS